MSNKQVTIPVFVPHHGCPHTCAFCNQWIVSNARNIPDKGHIHSIVKSHLATISPGIKRIEIAFFGGSFTGIPHETQQELLETAHDYLVRKKIHAIRLSTRPDYIDDSILKFLKQYHVQTIELGVQSFNDTVLMKSKRGHTANDVFRAVNLLKKHEFDFVIQLMPGLPGDTIEISTSNARIAAQLGPAAVRIYPTVILRGTQLEQLYNEQLFSPLSLEEAVEFSKEMVIIFNKHAIPVIRLGIHPLSENNKIDVIAGPYHPSIGFFVKSRVKRDILQHEIQHFLSGASTGSINVINISLPEKEKEEYIGHKKTNINFLKNLFNLDQIMYDYNRCNKIKITAAASLLD